MAKMTVAEAAQHFNVSKEAIHNRIRRGTLDCVIEHGVKYVVIGEAASTASEENSRYHDYIEEENKRLKAKVEQLESETKELRIQREQMLIAERDKVEQIYKERDEQLRQVLQTVATKFLSHVNVDAVIEEAVTAEVIEEVAAVERPESLVTLKQFMKLKQYKKKQREKIKARFKKLRGRDERVITDEEGAIYLDPRRFDYKDLLKN